MSNGIQGIFKTRLELQNLKLQAGFYIDLSDIFHRRHACACDLHLHLPLGIRAHNRLTAAAEGQYIRRDIRLNAIGIPIARADQFATDDLKVNHSVVFSAGHIDAPGIVIRYRRPSFSRA